MQGNRGELNALKNSGVNPTPEKRRLFFYNNFVHRFSCEMPWTGLRIVGGIANRENCN